MILTKNNDPRPEGRIVQLALKQASDSFAQFRFSYPSSFFKAASGESGASA